MNVSGVYWYFTFTALSRSAVALEESLSKVRKDYLRMQEVDIGTERVLPVDLMGSIGRHLYLREHSVASGIYWPEY